MNVQLSSKGKGTKGTVIVIGAGLAGLACARQLLMWGYKVIILEARKRPGTDLAVSLLISTPHTLTALHVLRRWSCAYQDTVE